MSVPAEPSLENHQAEPEDQKGKTVRTKDLLKVNQRDRRTRSPLRLFKEDFSELKEEVLKVFRDKDKEPEQRPAASSTLTLLREDFNQFREDLTSVFSIRETKSSNRLSWTLLRDDLSSALRIGSSKDRDAAREEPPDGLKVKDDERPESPFRRDHGTPQGAEKDEERTNDGEQSDDDVTDGIKELDPLGVDQTNTTQESEIIPPSQAGEQRCVVSAEDERREEEAEEEEKTHPLDSSSGSSLLTLRDPKTRPGGDVWSVKNFACYLTFDPNTANSELQLADCNRRAVRVWSDYRASNHPERFDRCPQLLCREGLLDSAYWEVVWSGGADIGVTYNSISRHGDAARCLLGHSERSWALECSEGSYTPCHDRRRFRASAPRPFTHRVGVHLDWSAGSLSFYGVSQDAMVHLHTFSATFTEPLYPAFWVWAYGGSVSLRQVELDWERLLQ